MEPDLAQWVPDLLPKRKHNTPDDIPGATAPHQDPPARSRPLDEPEPPDDDLDDATTERSLSRIIRPNDDDAHHGG